MSGFLGWIQTLSIGKKIAVGSVTLFTAAAVASPTPPPAQPPASTTPPAVQALQTTEQSKPKTETKTVIETQKIAFETITQNDAFLDKGKVLTATTGIDGEKALTYEVTYTDSVETTRKLISETVTRQPVNAVTKVGTKVYVPPVTTCSGGYINVDGNCVKSPGSSPDGATAKCRDGTYSYSQNRQGTCSHHGGVAQWL